MSEKTFLEMSEIAEYSESTVVRRARTLIPQAFKKTLF